MCHVVSAFALRLGDDCNKRLIGTRRPLIVWSDGIDNNLPRMDDLGIGTRDCIVEITRNFMAVDLRYVSGNKRIMSAM